MYAIGMLGSYVSQGVYAVAGPFQGAVDIIVVQQEDGTYKSSPWYVKCGDFQGVLTRREKVVNISVNGTPAEFYMLLNNRGEAYFEKEVEDAVLALPSTSGSEMTEDKQKLGKSDNLSSETVKGDSQEDEKSPLSKSSIDKQNISQQDVQVLALAPAPADPLNLDNEPWDSGGEIDPKDSPKSPDHDKECSTSTGAGKKKTFSVREIDSNESDSDFEVKPVVINISHQDVQVPAPSDSLNLDNEPWDLHGEINSKDAPKSPDHDEECSTSTGAGKMKTFSVREIGSNESDSDFEVKPVVINVSEEGLVLADADGIFLEREPFEQREQGPWPLDVGSGLQKGPDEAIAAHPLNEISDEIASTGGMDDALLCNTVVTEDWFGLQEPSTSDPGKNNASFKNNLEPSSLQSMDELIWNDYKIVTAEEEGALNDSLRADSVLGVRIDGEDLQASSLAPATGPLDSSVWVSDALVDDATTSAENLAGENRIIGQNSGKKPSLVRSISVKDVVCRVNEGPPAEGTKAAELSAIAVVPPSSRWAMWPLSFIRSRGEKASVSESAAKKQALLAATNIAVGSPLTQEILRKNGYYAWTQKPKLRSYVPTSSQIESLKLNDGPNKVTFLFPRVLGKTQVDANIYLWKWNTRIVISDVDGTITKSDVLGQFMPLVGRDWSQSGVTRLFSAIKENGYEVLFLSARAISQAYLTRQFLINLKQDGETLPEGPVFISPDGLIPSLYREVVRRTPHEFKISCLEGIRRLFPKDVNPFYAGFGNRDTDEISYIKAGIPKGKIFIINPKGEVMVNHHVDVKSYTSIHALVDDMFPPVYSSEQEDFNSWNYWKLPLPSIGDDELSATAKSTKPKKGAGLKK